MKKQYIPYFLILLIQILFFSCEKDTIQTTFTYYPPEQLDDDLEISSLETEGLDTKLIEFMIDHINEEKYRNVHSVLIVRNDKLVLEQYFNGYTYNMYHKCYSVTKSFCSALVGIALDKQYINSVDDPIKTYLAEYTNVDWTGKEDITIHHMLTMTAGFKWDEWSLSYFTPGNSCYNMYVSSEPVRYVLQMPVVSKPGTDFTYNTGISTTLGKIVTNAIDMEFDTFATRYLFKPLGIERHRWYVHPSGIYGTGGDLQLTSRDMVKFGMLYLNNGIWKGQQIISEEWIRQSINSYISPWSETYYGYQWWKMPLLLPNGQRIEGYHAEGLGGQYIFVLPAYKMVVVITGYNEGDLHNQPKTILQQYILPAIE